MSKARWRKARWVGLAVYCCVALLAATSCGGDDDEEAGGGTTTTEATEGMMTSIGEAEGQLNLINWAGYVEKDWVTPFEQETGCKVSSKVGATSDEQDFGAMVTAIAGSDESDPCPYDASPAAREPLKTCPRTRP